MVNTQLVAKLNLPEDTIRWIAFLQSYRGVLGESFQEGKISVKEYLELWTQNEYSLQELWGFPKDPNYHKFWEMAGCTCPKMDNEDAYPTGYYIRVGDCPLHGEHTWQK